MAISIDTSVVSPVLIGREATLTSLENIFAQARAGQGKLVYLSGEAGVGKSRLVAEVRSRFERENACILQGACFEQDIDLPFSPLVDLLRTLLNPASRQESLPKLLPFAPEILKILPELRFWLPEQRPSAPLEPEQEKRRLFVTLANFLLEQAGERVLVLIIEDLHWSDDTSLEFLSFLRRYLGARSFLLLLTYRGEERLPALQRFLVGLDRERLARKIVLEPLTAEEVQAMVRSIFRMKKPVRRDFMEALYQLTEGNPFFVEEVLKSLLARGEIFFAGGIWDRKPLTQLHIPGSIFDAVQQRISLLGEAEREMLSLAAVLGRKVDIALLQALMGYAEVELMKGIEILIASQLLVDISGEQCEFRHALIQQSVYQGLLALKRKSLHLKIAKTIAQIYASSLDAHMADLAYHYYQAQEWEQAQEYARKAGERALALFSSRAALDQLTRAIEAASHLSQVDTIALYHLRGQAHEFLGNFEESQLDFEQMLLAARATGDRVAEWDGLMDIGILWTGRDLRRAGEFFQGAYNLSQTLSDPQRYLSSHMRLANWKFNVGEAETAIEMYENILDALRTPERRPVLAIALADLGLAYGFYGDSQRSLTCYEEAIPLLRLFGNKRVISGVLAFRGNIVCPALSEPSYSVPGSLVECQRDNEESLQLAEAIKWRAGEALAFLTGGMIWSSYGHLGEGLMRAKTALDIASEIENHHWMAGAYYSLGEAYFALLDYNQALEVLEAGLKVARPQGSAFWTGHFIATLALACGTVGNFQRAELLLEEGLPQGQAPHNVHERRMVWVRAELALMQRKPEEALYLAETLSNSAPGQMRERPIPMLLKVRGQALVMLGRFKEGCRLLEEARRAAHELGACVFLWQIQCVLVHVYLLYKKRVYAHRELGIAYKMLDELANSIDEGEQRERFRSAARSRLPSVRPLTSKQAAKESFDGLSEREREIARLIVLGKTNREIAEALVISQRTVGTHLEHMYAKLNLGTRAQLTIWAISKGLGE